MQPDLHPEVYQKRIMPGSRINRSANRKLVSARKHCSIVIGAESVSVGQCIFHYRPALHHELHLLQHGDVGKRIALYGN